MNDSDKIEIMKMNLEPGSTIHINGIPFEAVYGTVKGHPKNIAFLKELQEAALGNPLGVPPAMIDSSRIVDHAERSISPSDSVRKLVDAVEAFIERLEMIHSDSSYQSVWTLNLVHNGQYTGPKYDKHLDALREALTAYRKEMEK